ncbi:hypothetical protein NDU88_007029 [Pleurodeles waltl]|uniref:Uncharacterized protein n=1 Tax=Pleurodeles waltl TaxID=8319 RepID=A0AAV7VSM7_PLEWA|nr:hypothetical protein NDU88_007029 [Pleurodeles waltl]
MGKHDAKQPKLNFDHKRSTRQGELEQGPQAAEGCDLAADDQGEDLRTLMLEMRSSLRNIDTKLDNLASQLDSVKTQMATHETRAMMWLSEKVKSWTHPVPFQPHVAVERDMVVPLPLGVAICAKARRPREDVDTARMLQWVWEELRRRAGVPLLYAP